MNLTDTLRQARQEGRLAFMAHVYAGYPSLEFTRRMIETLRPSIDILELGIPYSDPLADGPIFQRACREALDRHLRVNDVFRLVDDLREDSFDRPIVLTTYFNVIFHAGIERFTYRLAKAGAAGLIVPDLPPEEAGELQGACAEAGLALIHLVAPTTSIERLGRILERAAGFIYVVSVTGVTGSGEAGRDALTDALRRLRPLTDLPLLFGFGISRPEQATAIPATDGFIIGSALCRLYNDRQPEAQSLAAIDRFARQFRHLPKPSREDQLIQFSFIRVHSQIVID